MSDELIVPFDEQILRLASCLNVHGQCRSDLQHYSSNEYVELIENLCRTKQTQICGIVKKNSNIFHEVFALAFYRIHSTTFDTIRFELYDLVVDEQRRRQGLGTRLLKYLIEQAKQSNAPWFVLQCDLNNREVHRFFFRHNFSVSSFGFMLETFEFLPNNDKIRVTDVTDLPDEINEEYLLKAQNVFRQLRPNLPAEKTMFIDRIRTICRTGPARILIGHWDEFNGEVLGIAIYRILHNFKYSKFLYCDDLITDQTKRSLGVGRALINEMKRQAKTLSVRCLALDSGVQRGRAHKFYHREGFHIDQLEMTLNFEEN